MLTLYQELKKRNLIYQVTSPELEHVLDQGKVSLYAGFDPTSSSLHVGSLLPLFNLLRFLKSGHDVIFLIGGGTASIGDPSGKTKERLLLEKKIILENTRYIKKYLEDFLSKQTFSGTFEIMNNLTWIEPLSLLKFLRTTGKHFPVTYMLHKESVQARLEQNSEGLSFAEFSYMLLQAYDFWFLYKNHHCTLQLGGSDQWGNITAGCELIRRMNSTAQSSITPVFGLTFPLLTKSDGSKFGKTEQGTLWLDAKKTPVFDFYQYFMRLSDRDVEDLFWKLSFQSLEQITDLLREHRKSPEKRLAQKALAEEITTLIHGPKETSRVQRASKLLYGKEKNLTELDEKSLLEIFHHARSSQISKSLLEKEPNCVQILSDTKLCSSKTQARKDLLAGSISINLKQIKDPEKTLSTKDLLHQKWLILRRGKKHYHLVQFV